MDMQDFNTLSKTFNNLKSLELYCEYLSVSDVISALVANNSIEKLILNSIINISDNTY
jgi:hypothetical protein